MKPMLLLALIAVLGLNDNPKDTILVEIEYPDGVREFIRQADVESYYKDMISEGDTVSKEQHLDDLIKFRLKLKQAVDEGLDKDSAIIEDIARYKERMSVPYLMDRELVEPLVSEYYERSKYELRAMHILVRMAEEVLGDDTLASFNKALEIKRQIEKGMSFEDAAVKYSEDPSAKENRGDLGYFSVGATVYPFENVAYHAEVGKVSGPIRTLFGYHLLKVVDKRDMRWQRFSHIFIPLHPKAVYADSVEAYYKINELKQRILSGEKFEDVAKEYSEDKETQETGGDLGTFAKGEIPFSGLGLNGATFDLKNEGDMSEVIRTDKGLHVLKLVKKDMPSIESSRDETREKVLADQSRVLAKRKDLVVKLKRDIRNSINDSAFVKIRKQFREPMQVYRVKLSDKERGEFFCRIASQTFTLNDFFSYAKQTAGASVKVDKEGIDILKEEFVSTKLISEATNMLEKTSAEFSSILQKYKTGSMVFALTQKKVWDASAPTEDEMKQHFEKNKNLYKYKYRVFVSALQMMRKDEADDIYLELTKKKRVRAKLSRADVQMLRKLLLDSLKLLSKNDAKFSEKKKAIQKEIDGIIIDEKPRTFERLKEIYPTTFSAWQSDQDARFELGRNVFTDEMFKVKDKQVSKPFYYNRHFYILRKNAFEPSRQMTYEEAKSDIYSDCQEQKTVRLMNEWLSKLRQGVSIKINSDMAK